MSSQSNASEPNYDELYSNRYTAITGFDLSEDGVKKALEHFDQLHPLHRLASIAVVGEQNYQSLTGYIKDIYNRRPEHAPDASVAFFYSHRGTLDQFQIYSARALVRCGDPEGEQFAIEQALRSPSMSISSCEYAIRTLKYLVHQFGTDVHAELEFLISVDPGRNDLSVSRYAVRELIEIQKYLELKSDSREAIYSAAIERQILDGDSRTRNEISRRTEQTGISWSESAKLIDAQR